MQPFDMLIVDIGEIVTCDPKRENAQDVLGRITDGAIGIRGTDFCFVGKQSELPPQAQETARKIISARGASAIAGLIDSHTHPVFGGTREQEFAQRIAGVPYMEIAQQGGGINATVRATREASEEQLATRSMHWLDEFLRWGVTTIEAKSGYGLDTESELKQLRVIRKLNETHSVDLVATFLGAHEFPPEYKDRREDYVDLIVNGMLPRVASENLAKFCDVFCEEGVFTVAQARRILEEAGKLGMALRFHADEFVNSDGAKLACELGAVAADHLMAITDENIQAMADANVIAALLPGTSYYLGKTEYAPARKFIEAGVRVVLASDFNPGSCVCSNLPLIMNLGCTQLRMTFEEVLLSVTRHAADSLLLGERIGRIANGYQADLLLLDVPRPEYLTYHFGRNHTYKVMKNGQWVYENPVAPVFLSE